MIQLYIQLLEPLEENPTRAYISLKSVFPLFICKFLKITNIEVKFILKPDKTGIWIKLNEINYTIEANSSSSWISACELPSMRLENFGISGFCCICRQLVKSTENEKDLLLLGFRQRSLNTPSDSSPWTKLCEVEMVQCFENFKEYLINDPTENIEYWDVPEEFLRLEMHLSLPMKIHNLPKYLLNKNHSVEEARYIDGQTKTILDIIIWIFYTSIFERIEFVNIQEKLPHSMNWYNEMSNGLKKIYEEFIFKDESIKILKNVSCKITKQVPQCRIYKIESKRNGVVQKYTVQKDVDSALEKIYALGLDLSSKNSSDYKIDFDWSSLPVDVNPFNGNLPNKRMLRKQQQLENMALEVVKISQKGDVIVDFCCGTGHLGILIACLLPDCHIILLDNNEESLVVRAREWVSKLGLTNISYFLGNINYFNGNFNTGVSLHACGSATDIVLSKCHEKRAKFVTVGCCYGSISNTPTIIYPQSKMFRNRITNDDFITLAHCADQGHDPANAKTEESLELSEQGGLCTDIIDTDRKLKAEEFGYKVTLKRLHPESCTPRNRLLVGVI